MKKTFGLVLVLSALSIGPVVAQTPVSDTFAERVKRIKAQAEETAASRSLSKFNLDFPGGTPRQLADAIEKSMGKPVNIIIPEEYADAKLPPIKVTDVTVPQLFQTLLEGGTKRSSGPGPSYLLSSYGFKTIDGPQTDASIWTFFVYNNQDSPGLTTFNIDFPGGAPKELVAAIQKATKRPLNVIIPAEYADTKLPPLKMNGVNVNQLFRALGSASTKVESYSSFPGGAQRTSSYGFKTDGNTTDDSIWYFYVDKLPSPAAYSPEKISRFYALAPYLDHGLTVDDITTAVETAWKMTGEKSPPQISFHKDTKLLIAVGEPEKLKTIDSVLQALKPEPQVSPVLRSLMQKKESEGRTNE